MKQRKSDRRHSVFSYTFLSAILLTSCATAPPPKTAEVVDDALPESTEIRDDWAAGAGDSGRVDDGWISTFNDPMLNELVDEAIHNNLNLRLAASQVDRAAGLARMAGASLKPAVGLHSLCERRWPQTRVLGEACREVAHEASIQQFEACQVARAAQRVRDPARGEDLVDHVGAGAKVAVLELDVVFPEDAAEDLELRARLARTAPVFQAT